MRNDLFQQLIDPKNSNEFDAPRSNVSPLPVGYKNPQPGHSNEVARADHIHQLEAPDKISYVSGFNFGGSTANLVATANYFVDSNEWIEVEIGIAFTGAVGAGAAAFNLPFPVAFPDGNAGVGRVIQMGLSTLMDTHTPVFHYNYRMYVAANSPSLCYTIYNPIAAAVWTNAAPFAIANGDEAMLNLRYRTTSLLGK